MARRSSFAAGDLMGYAFVGFGLYLGYTEARKGRLGKTAQQLAIDIHDSLSGLTPKGLGGGGGASSQCGMQAGYRYVAGSGNPSAPFVVVWKGATYNYYSDQASAEQAYNALVAAQGCV